MTVRLLFMLWVSTTALANPADDLKAVGHGEMNWMFWKLYDIQLLSSNGRYEQQRYPVALVIRYARKIEAARLVETTRDQWQHLSLPWQETWLQQLQQIWPTVDVGDELMFRIEADLTSRFYYNGQFIGQINDPAFADAFLAIWLSPNTIEPGLRQQLLGEPNA